MDLSRYLLYSWSAFVAPALNEIGACAVILNYDLCPQVSIEQITMQMVKAMAWTWHNIARFGGNPKNVSVAGHSAGGHLAGATVLRMRDRYGYTGFRGANLVYGAFDMSMTPSQRQFGDRRLVLRTIDMQQFYNAFLPTGQDRRDPDISPLYANLKGLCPALFSVGTADALLDDTLFMHARWIAAGNEAELAIYPGGAHGFTLFPNALSVEASARMDAFLKRVTA